MPWTRFSGRLVLGRSHSDPQEGLFGFLLVANREVCVRAAAAETPTITTVHSKKNFMISIFGSVSGFARFTLRVRARESLTGIHLLLSSQHSSRASPKPNLPTRMPREALITGSITVYRTSPLIFNLSPVNWGL